MATEKSNQVYNPFLPLDVYIPDGEPHVFGNRVYLFGSHDKEGGETFCMLDYDVYSAPVTDLTKWEKEGTIYQAKQDPDYMQPNFRMYAPDVVQGVDGRYYLYYAMAGSTFTSPIHVAVCDRPAGKYEYFGCVRNSDSSPYTRCITFDPAVINDDGKIWLYYGWSLGINRPLNANEASDEDVKAMEEQLIQIQMQMFGKTKREVTEEPKGIMGANVVRIADDMLTVISEPARIVPGQFNTRGTSFEEHGFFEASSIRKIEDTYFFIYSSEKHHELCYATSRYPNKDFVFRGTIISNGDIGFQGRKDRERVNTTGNNHGSIECINGEWYVFYHRHTHKSLCSRQACAEKIVIMEDGEIQQVEMTSAGLNGGPLKAKGHYSAVIACNLSNGNMPHIETGIARENIPYITHENERRFITGIENNTIIGYKYFEFTGKTSFYISFRGNVEGDMQVIAGDKVIAVIQVEHSDMWKKSGVKIDIYGTQALYLKYQGTGKMDLAGIEFND